MSGGSLVRGLAAVFLLSGVASAQSVHGPVLTGATVIVLSPTEVGPVKKAAGDLANDFEKVFGRRPAIVTTMPASGTAIVVGRRSGAPESFSIHARGREVRLDGADMRGAIYAIYELSQDYLGVDPLYYWTDREPAKKMQVALPDGLARDFPAPLFKYRGFFINDEDMLTGWAPGERLPERSGIRLSVMDKIYETVLRLKGNMIVPGTWTFPTDPQMKPVGERGLILTQHHAIPVGMNVARWPDKVPYSMSQHPEILERAWTNAVNSYDPKQEILWSVGLRGLSDTPYASMDPSVVGNDKLQGDLISKAIQTQMRIVRARFPDAEFDTDLWQEGARLAQEGYLKIPPEVMTVWADTGYGLVKDGGAVAKGQGMYTHVAMLNGRANQLSEMVPADRIYSEFGRYIKAGATAYMLVNTSDIRAVTLGTRTMMDTAWGGVPDGGAAATYRKWSAAEFGDRAADAVGRVYRDYFAAIPKLPSGEDYGDQLYHTEARQLMMSAMVSLPHYDIPGQAPKWSSPRIIGLDPATSRGVGPDYVEKTTARELKVCAEAQGRWDAVWRDAQKAEGLVDPARKPFYDYAVLTMIAINRDSNHILLQISKAVHDAQAGDRAKAKAEALSTLADFDEIKRLEKQSEYGKWQHWWRGEWLVGIDSTRALVGDFVRWLDDPETTLPPPAQSNSWQAYYHIMHYEGDQTADVK